MFERAFEEELRICWLLYCKGGHCAVREYLSGRPAAEVAKVLGRMQEFARLGNWDARVGFIKRLDLPPRLNHFPIFEVKSHQDRILFFRSEMNAVAFGAIQKKNDWSKKDQRALEAAVEVALAARAACGGGR